MNRGETTDDLGLTGGSDDQRACPGSRSRPHTSRHGQTWSEQASRVVEASALQLAALVQRSGKFVYEYGAPASPSRRKYNLLRHCGAIWSLTDAASDLADPGVVDARAQRALDWLLRSRTERFGDGLCVTGRNRRAKLGGAALGVMACLGVYDRTGEPRYLAAAQGLGRFIRQMRRPHGQFVHKVDLPARQALAFSSDYYTAQALFALVRLSEVTGDDDWITRAPDTVANLEAGGDGIAVQNHWLVYALVHLHSLAPAAGYRRYAGRIVEHIIQHPNYRCRQESTPLACRSEALLAFLQSFPVTRCSDLPDLEKRALATLQWNLTKQLEFKTGNGEFVKSHREPKVRIDYIQHNLTAFTRFVRCYNEMSAGNMGVTTSAHL